MLRTNMRDVRQEGVCHQKDHSFNDLSPFVLHLSQFFLHLSPFAFPKLHEFTKVNHAPA